MSLAQIAPEQALQDLVTLRAQQWVRTEGIGKADTIEPFHDRIRESLVAALAPDALRAHHLALALALDTGLSDISGLAYSSTGQLYAVDAAWDDPRQGGVFRLDDARTEGHQACRAVKVAAVTRGISLAFAPDGALYVTSLGPSGRSKEGSLVKITGRF